MNALADWAASGAMALTGRDDGPPLAAPGRPASVVRETLQHLALEIPGLLGERAAYAGLTRRGPWSCGGAMRVLPTYDGHLALSLARPSDIELVPALVQGVVSDPWAAVAAWASAVPTQEAAARVEVLGLPGGAVPTEPVVGSGVSTTVLGTRTVADRPWVVDLTSLWAGPLCAHLLGLSGARVVKIESSRRPDGAREGTPAFFELLHAGHDQLTLDFRHPDDLERLRDLVATADLVLEASRPRALRQLGIDAERVVRDGTSWLSITARGRDSNAIGFGDDVAACAGLVVPDGDDLLPVGDAIADPLTGVTAAVAAHDALHSSEARLIDVSMLHVTAATVGPVPEHETAYVDGSWWAEDETGRHQVVPPVIRR
ncbi:MAG: putative CoA-transferase, family [Marmoricola sp.]|nr:putative CoA-transferase, family [Marmoricola sp.]